jgi:hypothetical protein
MRLLVFFLCTCLTLSALDVRPGGRDDAIKYATQIGGDWRKVNDTPSMLGTPTGDYVVTVKAPYAVGDLIIFRSHRGFILHPITSVKPGFVYTKGSFNRNGDGWTPIGMVEGKVVRGYKACSRR